MHSGRMPRSDSKLPHATVYLRTGLRAEFALLRQRKVILAALAIIFVPSLYVLIYVSSVWDPYGNLHQLPAALVNQDVPVKISGREINLGGDVVATLEKQRPFAFVRFATPEAARAAVRAGDVFFALVVPADFSRTAVESGQPAQLGIYVSEGGNYTAAIFSKRFGSELAHTINEKLNRGRWAALVGETGGADEPSLRSGLLALQAGGRRLAEGAERGSGRQHPLARRSGSRAGRGGKIGGRLGAACGRFFPSDRWHEAGGGCRQHDPIEVARRPETRGIGWGQPRCCPRCHRTKPRTHSPKPRRGAAGCRSSRTSGRRCQSTVRWRKIIGWNRPTQGGDWHVGRRNFPRIQRGRAIERWAEPFGSGYPTAHGGNYSVERRAGDLGRKNCRRRINSISMPIRWTNSAMGMLRCPRG